MKIQPQDLQVLKVKLLPFINDHTIKAYETGNFSNSASVKDLQKRFCFDLLYASRVKIGDGIGIMGDINLYSYMNDEHIYTAIKSFAPKLTRKF